MPRKIVILVLAATLAQTGCQTRPADAPAPAADGGKALAEPRTPSRPAPRTNRPAPARPSPAAAGSPAPQPLPAAPRTGGAADLADLIEGESRWTDQRRALVVTGRGATDPAQPVPLFRQAIVIASVRSALAGSPSEPEAAFRNGQLTLAFQRGSPSEIAAAVNRTLAVPEVTQLVVVPPAP